MCSPVCLLLIYQLCLHYAKCLLTVDLVYFPKLIFPVLKQRNVELQRNAFPSSDALNFSDCPIHCNVVSTNDFKHRNCMLHITIVIPSGLLWYDLTETYGLASTMCVKNWLPYHFKWECFRCKSWSIQGQGFGGFR